MIPNYLLCRHSEPELRPTFFDVLLVLQRPDFQLLNWLPDDVATYSEQARTLGAPVEAGEELYTELQKTYLLPGNQLSFTLPRGCSRATL